MTKVVRTTACSLDLVCPHFNVRFQKIKNTESIFLLIHLVVYIHISDKLYYLTTN